MTTLEGFMKQFADQLKHQELQNLLSSIPINRKSFHYGNWVVKVKNIAKSLPRSEIGKMNNCKRLLIILGDYLSTYNVALELHDLVLLRHVMGYLQRSFDRFQENKDCTPEEKAYFESFSELQEQMADQLDSENPNLTLMKTCLMKYIVAKGEASCGIIFVRTRALVRAVTSWLNHCGDWIIESLRAAPFTGTSASSALGGMTAAQQSEVIQLFRKGTVRLLVATSVAEEGIDIPECNLVIKYNYTGNEITTVQTRGRSRKKGGVSVILAMSKIIEKERLNQKRAEMMDQAVRQIRQMDPLEIHKKVQAQQQKILKDDENNETLKRQRNRLKRNEHFKMVCHGCSKLIINSSDIRTVYHTHHVVVNWNIMKQTQTVAETDSTCFDDIKLIGPVKCKGRIEGGRYCGSKLGSLMIFSSIPFVVLGVKQFGFESAGLKKLGTYRNWKFVPYVIDEMTQEDVARYLPEATASETKHSSSSSQPYETFFSVSQHTERQGRRDDVGNPDKRRGKASSAGNFNPYSNNAQVHGTLSFQTSVIAERGRGALPGSATNSGAMCELGDNQIESCALFIGWTNLESKLSSAGLPVSHETFPSLQHSEASGSDGGSVLTQQSDCRQKMMSEAGADNLDQPSSMERNREVVDMDTLTNNPVMTKTENTEGENSASCEDVDSEMEHLAEVGDTFHPPGGLYR